MKLSATSDVKALDEDRMGPKWEAHFRSLWPEYRAWFLSEKDPKRPTYLASLRAMRNYMPELIPAYERAVELAGGSDIAARMLSGYRPPAYISGCSQAIFRGSASVPRSAPALVRNYDYAAVVRRPTSSFAYGPISTSSKRVRENAASAPITRVV